MIADKIGFVVNGEPASAMGERARSFAMRLGEEFDIEIAYRNPNKLRAIANFFGFLVHVRPRLTYVFDMAFSGVIAAALYRMIFRNRLIIDTGDAIYELSKSMGRGPVGRMMTLALEKFSLRVADHLVVRGSYHRELLKRKGYAASLIPDGVDLAQFAPRDSSEARAELGLSDSFVVGVIGSSMWSEHLRLPYGWDLVEVVRLLKDRPVKGLLVGDGSGIEHLRTKCREAGIEDRVVFAGRRQYEELPELLAAMDVCLSTQTNDLPGQVRTTGKLPLYLAAGRYVLGSRAGEAARVLPEEMLVDYEGTIDTRYPAKIAEKISQMMDHPEILGRAKVSRNLAAKYFDYDVLADRLRWEIRSTLGQSN